MLSKCRKNGFFFRKITKFARRLGAPPQDPRLWDAELHQVAQQVI